MFLKVCIATYILALISHFFHLLFIKVSRYFW